MQPPMKHSAFFLVIEFVVYAFGIALFCHAWKKGIRWVSTLVWGGVFGVVIEHYFVSTPGAISYQYSPEFQLKLWSGKEMVPLWIGVGWGCLLYASTWTAQRLRLNWALGSLTAAILAINIDLSLDPIAHYLRFWHWEYPADKLTYYEVPFDNYMGWFCIVASYSMFVRRGFFWYEKRFPRPLAQVTAGVPSKNAEWIIPIVAAVAATGVVLVTMRDVLPWIYQHLPDWLLFLIVFFVSFVTTCCAAARSKRTGDVAWAMLAMPVFFHVFAIVLLLSTDAYQKMPTLLVAIPGHLLAGVLGYGWPSIETLIERANRFNRTRLWRRISGTFFPAHPA